jgi:hypothetical protein
MRIPILLSGLLLAGLLPGCDLAPPNRENEAQQKVDDAAQKNSDQNTELRDTLQTPIDRAKSANDPNVQHDKDQEKAVEDSGG